MTANAGAPIRPYLWATAETLYPAGANPWNGQPVNVAPAGDIFTPNTRPPAENFNYILNRVSADEDAQRNWTVSGPALNWGIKYAITSAGEPTAAAFAQKTPGAIGPAWLIATRVNSNTSRVFLGNGLDGAGSWTQLGGDFITAHSNRFVADILPDNVGGRHLAIVLEPVGTPAAPTMYKLNAGGTAWASTATFTLGYTSARMITFNSTYILALCDSAGASPVGGGSTSPDGVTWTGAFSDGTAGAFAEWYLAASPNSCLALPSISQATESGFWKTTNGTTWAHVAPASFPVTGTAAGMCYAQTDNGGAYIVGTQVGSTIHFWKSGDEGVTWLAQGSLTTVFGVLVGLAAFGSLIIATCEDTASSGATQMLFSIDGGSTWYYSMATSVNAAPATVYYTPNRVRVGDSNLVNFNTEDLRFSEAAGLPPAVS